MSWGVELCDGHCPYCGEPVQLLVDKSAGTQRYVEDCQVCCQPMVVLIESVEPLAMRLLNEDDAWG